MAANRVIFLTHAAEFGGAELSLLEILERLDRGRVAPVLASLAHGPLTAAVENLGVTVHLLDAPSGIVSAKRADAGLSPAAIAGAAGKIFASFPVIGELTKLIRAERADTVYTNSSKAHLIGGIAGRRSRARVIWHFRDYFPAQYLRMMFAGFAAMTADTVICNSEFTATQFGSHRDCRVVLNGLPPDKIKPSRTPEEVKTELGIPRGTRVVGFAGRLERWKGVHVFIKAAAGIAREFPDTRFIVVGAPIYGDDAYPAELKSVARALGIADKVIFTGFRPDVYDLINMFDIYVHPSVDPEPFGRGIVEAMLLGKPVVASDLGGPREIIADGETGLFFPAGDADRLAQAVVSLLSAPELAAAAGAAGRKRALLLFNSDRSVAHLTDIITGRKD